MATGMGMKSCDMEGEHDIKKHKRIRASEMEIRGKKKAESNEKYLFKISYSNNIGSENYVNLVMGNMESS
jgi:hypothetical protein